MSKRRGRLLLVFWLVLSAIWIGGITQISLRSWPQMPLDISRDDPQTRKAYSDAVNRYIGQVALVAIAPPLVLIGFGLGWSWLRRRQG